MVNKMNDNTNRAIDLLNKLFPILDIQFKDFNKKFFSEKNKKELENLKLIYPELNLIESDDGEKNGISIVGLIASLTEVLINQRLAIAVDSKTKKITGATIYSE